MSLQQNDIESEIFTLKRTPAISQLDFALKTPRVKVLSMWSVGRDKTKGTGTYDSSGIPQAPLEFTRTFMKFNGR